jgi:hypothetical protein
VHSGRINQLFCRSSLKYRDVAASLFHAGRRQIPKDSDLYNEIHFNLTSTIVMNSVQHMGTIPAVTLIRTDTGRCIPGESPPFRPHVATHDFSLLGGSENFEGKNQIKLVTVSFLQATQPDGC